MRVHRPDRGRQLGMQRGMREHFAGIKPYAERNRLRERVEQPRRLAIGQLLFQLRQLGFEPRDLDVEIVGTPRYSNLPHLLLVGGFGVT